jgi:hypothetical protein
VEAGILKQLPIFADNAPIRQRLQAIDNKPFARRLKGANLTAKHERLPPSYGPAYRALCFSGCEPNGPPGTKPPLSLAPIGKKTQRQGASEKDARDRFPAAANGNRSENLKRQSPCRGQPPKIWGGAERLN